jgi:hypothetical protein
MIQAEFSILICSGLLAVAIKHTVAHKFYMMSVTMFSVPFFNSTKYASFLLYKISGPESLGTLQARVGYNINEKSYVNVSGFPNSDEYRKYVKK